MDAVSPPKPKVLVEAQPFIPYMKEENFDPRLKPVLDPYKKRMGFLPNALKLYAYRPEIAETLWALNSKVMRDPTSTIRATSITRSRPAAIRRATSSPSATPAVRRTIPRPGRSKASSRGGWWAKLASMRRLSRGTTRPISNAPGPATGAR